MFIMHLSTMALGTLVLCIILTLCDWHVSYLGLILFHDDI
jgi:hypothetical protein